MCNDLTHAFANVLNKTGYVECIIDFFCMDEITSRGMGWYENKIKSCDIIIVVCTKYGKKIYDEKQHKKGSFYQFICFAIKLAKEIVSVECICI